MGFFQSLGWEQETYYWLIAGFAAIFLTTAFCVIYYLGTKYKDGHSASAEDLARIPQSAESTQSAALERALAADAAPELQADRQPELVPVHPVQPVHPVRAEEPAPKALSAALANTRSSFFGRIRSLFGTKDALTSDEMEELEEILYTSDLGPQTVQRLLDAVQEKLKAEGGTGIDAVRGALKKEMLAIFDGVVPAPKALHLVVPGFVESLEDLNIWHAKPAVLMVVGVNGAGKTTTIGKLSARLAANGKKVLVAAGDTFRAAAGSQLKVWTDRAQVEIFSPENVTDPSAVGYAACEKAVAEGFDIVIIDTAGRLHTQKNLMEELKKMKRVMQKPIPEAPHEVLLVLDANSGQNALIQAREYNQALDVTGVVLTKLDGSAKGGVAIGLASEMKLPIKLIGVGEGINDLRKFSSSEFVDSIL